MQALRNTMKNRALPLSDLRTHRVLPLSNLRARHNTVSRTVRMFLTAVSFALLCARYCSADAVSGSLILEDPGDHTQYAAYEAAVGDTFSVEFIHSVNQSPVTDYFEIREDGIYGVKTVYYGFGAGVPTELEEGQTLTYGDDGSMIISGLEVKLNSLIYRVGTVSDHILMLENGMKISLRDLCGRSARVGFRFSAEGSTESSSEN